VRQARAGPVHKLERVPLNLIHGPPNSGRAGVIRRGLTAVLDRDPVLVVPTVDDVYSFERELCAGGAVLGAQVTTFDGLFRAVATAGGSPPRPGLTPAQRLGAVAAAIAEQRPRLGPLRGSGGQPGFPVALERLLEELQGAGLEPADVEAAAGTLEGSAYLGDVSALFAGYALLRDRLGLVDRHAVAREAIDLLGAEGVDWWRRPAFIYGFDDLTPNQLALIAALASVGDVTIALPYEEGNAALEDRTAPLLSSLEEIGIDSAKRLKANPDNTPDAPLLFHLERGFGAAEPMKMPTDEDLVLLRSAGERGEAEAIAAEVAGLLADGVEPEEIAIVARDPARRGPLLAAVLDSYGVPTALEAEVPAATTSVGGSLIALLEAVLGTGRPANLLRYLRGPSGVPPGRTDWFERRIRRSRTQTAGAALRLWEERFGELPADVVRVREAAARPQALAAAIGEMAAAMGVRTDSELEARAAAAISTAMAERAELDGLASRPDLLARALAGIAVRVWSGPVGERVRIADPYRTRAARFDNVFVASLQEGEFPRSGAAGVDPFLSEGQRESLGLPPRRDTEAEERYLFHACLALPRRRLFLSYRDSDENGVAETPSPFLDDVRRLLDPAPGETGADPVEARIRGRDLARVVPRIGEAPSETELARAIAARGADADAGSLLGLAGAEGEVAERIGARLVAAARAEAASRAPGPLANPAVIEALGEVPAYGGTTLEGFDVCSYRWFVSHELAPEPLDPLPDPLLQGGVVHAVLNALYRERPGGDPLPRQGSLDAWIVRSRELVAEVAAARMGEHPTERAMLRRIEGLLARFLEEEARRDAAGFEPWLLEAGFSDAEETERPALAIDGWRLHGAIDRVDRAPDGRALVIDYKLSGSVTPREKLEEEAKLQLQLYLIAVAELWEAGAVGGLYHPLRGTSARRPRGAVRADEAAELAAAYGISRTDLVDREGFEELLADSRRRAGEIVARMREGRIDRDPGPRAGLRGHGICPRFCDFAPICRRDRAPVEARDDDEDEEER
jgi:RecB family exonuclease